MNDHVQQFIRQAIESVEFGAVNFTIQKYEGLVSSADANKVSSHKVNGNAEALAMAGQLIRKVSEQIKAETIALAKLNKPKPYTPPNLTFTVFFNKDSQADRINVNDFKRKNFKDK